MHRTRGEMGRERGDKLGYERQGRDAVVAGREKRSGEQRVTAPTAKVKKNKAKFYTCTEDDRCPRGLLLVMMVTANVRGVVSSHKVRPPLPLWNFFTSKL